MARQARPIKLSDNDLRPLKTLLRRGSTPARTQTRARGLDLLHRGQHPDAIAATLQVTTATVYNLKHRYLAEGLEAALYDKPRSGRPVEIAGSQRAKITALACSAPPEGRARWTLRLLAGEAVELGHCQHLSHTQARKLLKKRTPTAPP
ncbi:MAG TPA: helix-turn-helix domain-containing protein [Blastocatellia bacterium]|nr:helix-turn-helix domain-containing protein [Blastocatellia bacterium]